MKMIWIILIMLGLIISLILTSVSAGFWVSVALFIVFLIAWVAIGFYKTQEDERTVMERNGAHYENSEPGLHWRMPRRDQIRARAYTCVFTLNLVTPERKINGQSVKGAKAFVRIIRPYDQEYMDDEGFEANPVYRSVYCVSNWEKGVIALLSDALEQGQFQSVELANGRPTPIAVVSPEASEIMRRWGLTGDITVDLQPK